MRRVLQQIRMCKTFYATSIQHAARIALEAGGHANSPNNGPPLRRERQPRGRRGPPTSGNVEIGKQRTPPGGTAASYWSLLRELNDSAVSGGDRFRSGALQIRRGHPQRPTINYLTSTAPAAVVVPAADNSARLAGRIAVVQSRGAAALSVLDSSTGLPSEIVAFGVVAVLLSTLGRQSGVGIVTWLTSKSVRGE